MGEGVAGLTAACVGGGLSLKQVITILTEYAILVDKVRDIHPTLTVAEVFSNSEAVQHALSNTNTVKISAIRSEDHVILYGDKEQVTSLVDSKQFRWCAFDLASHFVWLAMFDEDPEIAHALGTFSAAMQTGSNVNSYCFYPYNSI